MNITGGGKKVGYVSSGEWLNFTVNVKETDNYVLKLRMGSPSSTSKLWVEVDGSDITGKVQIPNTGGYESWPIFNLKLRLKAKVRLQAQEMATKLTSQFFRLQPKKHLTAYVWRL